MVISEEGGRRFSFCRILSLWYSKCVNATCVIGELVSGTTIVLLYFLQFGVIKDLWI